MAAQESTGFCTSCNRQVMIRRKGTNHVLHLLMACLTFGLWLPLWLWFSIKIGGWRCTICGLKVSRSLLG